jgi:pimeloyl-ACP methyl ester carboxylesterase
MENFPTSPHAGDLPGGRFAWLEAGPAEAEVALCLHGFPDHPRTFEPLLEPLLGAGYRVVAPWIRGYSPSVTSGPYHARQLATDALHLADAVSPGRPVLLIGHDWGAVAAWNAAALAPERFDALVALSVPHPSAFLRNAARHPRQLLRSWYIGAFQIPVLPEKVIRAGDFALLARLFRATDGRLPPYWDELRETMRASLPGPLGPYRALRTCPPTRRSMRIRTRTLHLTGARDGAIDSRMGAGQERWIDADFSSAVLDTDHFVHHEQPAVVARRIIEFVRRAG